MYLRRNVVSNTLYVIVTSLVFINYNITEHLLNLLSTNRDYWSWEDNITFGEVTYSWNLLCVKCNKVWQNRGIIAIFA